MILICLKVRLINLSCTVLILSYLIPMIIAVRPTFNLLVSSWVLLFFLKEQKMCLVYILRSVSTLILIQIAINLLLSYYFELEDQLPD